jgi:hypothetical protein
VTEWTLITKPCIDGTCKKDLSTTFVAAALLANVPNLIFENVDTLPSENMWKGQLSAAQRTAQRELCSGSDRL